jgi:site-specific DNA-methyltransferase (adenine-specific)
MKITDKITITNEDCMDLLRRTPDNFYDLAICDPPYGIGAGGKNFKSGTSKNTKIYRDVDWDSSIPNKDYFDELKRVSKHQIVWGGNYFFEYLGNTRCYFFWDKNQPMENYADGELAWTSFDKVAKKIKKDWFGSHAKESNQTERIHPTQKPIYVYEWILKYYAKQGDKILDTHLGSGSIAIACHDYGFELTCCELDVEYYNKAVERIKNHISQIKLEF